MSQPQSQPQSQQQLQTPSQPANNPHRSTGGSAIGGQSSFVVAPQKLVQDAQPSQSTNTQVQNQAQQLNINPQQVIEELTVYLKQFCIPELEATLAGNNQEVFLLDLTHLQAVKPDFYTQIQATPDLIYLFGDLGLHQVLEELLQHQLNELPPADRDHPQVKSLFAEKLIHIQNLRLFAHKCPDSEKTSMRSLSPIFIDRLISVEGLLVSKSETIPEAVQVTFSCKSCGMKLKQLLSKQTVNIPLSCSCGGKDISMNYDETEYVSKLKLKLQESPDSTKSGETPVNISCMALKQQMSDVQPGDQVVITCVYRVQPERLNAAQSAIRAQFKPFLDVMWIDCVKRGQKDIEAQLRNELFQFQAEQTIPDEIKELIPQSDSETDANLLKLVKSIAPSIFGQEYLQIKLALLLQAVQGTKHESLRQNIHLLLIGDPGQAKSQLIKFMAQITPRSVYTSGKNSSQAGLTAVVQRNQGDVSLEPGALVLASNGLCALDEFDKLDETVRGVLHECMEQQTVSVAKAGVVCTLQAQTAILAAANPIDSKYNMKKTVLQNLNLEASLISRFDLIFLLLDQNDQEQDRRLANHLMSLYFVEESHDTISTDLLKRYIQLSRQVVPKMSEQAKVELEQSYIYLRKTSTNGRVAATPRQLLALMRLSQARAKLRFADQVTQTDVKVAYKLLVSALKMSCTDENGLIDVQLINVDKMVDLEKIERVSKMVLKIVEKEGEISITNLVQKIGVQAGADIINEAVQLLSDQGTVSRAREMVFLVK
ncbi:DNA_replication licensing factor MCM4 [Hexamita inflata]|uniref:DNA replication licensing factor MCM4 n=1 Tax=Hexamita inflata TaxID=28002 RepID=A0AA86NQ87_9EUKA|nr:DNA replication licensing factor MCM4 [Hexamita inflata]